MATRIKWYDGNPISKKGLDRLLSGFAKDEYSDKKSRGFSHVAFSGNIIEGQYVQRFERKAEIEDPFGKIVEYPVVEFEKVVFRIGSTFPSIELVDPPRSLAIFFNQIAQILDFQVALSPIQVDVIRWLNAMEKEVKEMEVFNATASDITLSSSVAAKLLLSGKVDVRPFITSMTGKRPFVLSRVQLSGNHNHQRFKCELTADARGVVMSGVESEIANLLRNCLRNASDAR